MSQERQPFAFCLELISYSARNGSVPVKIRGPFKSSGQLVFYKRAKRFELN